MPVPVGAILMGASVVANVMGASASSRARRLAAKEEAARREAQALEEERRSARELMLFKRKGQSALGSQVSAYTKAGVSLSDSALLNVASSAANLNSDAVEMERASKQQVALIRMGAAGLRQEARDIARSQPLELAGTVLGGIGGILERQGR